MNLTAFQRFQALKAQLVMTAPITQGQILKQMEDLLAEQQNGPPLGTGDGSFNAQTWKEGVELCKAARVVQRSTGVFA